MLVRFGLLSLKLQLVRLLRQSSILVVSLFDKGADVLAVALSLSNRTLEHGDCVLRSLLLINSPWCILENDTGVLEIFHPLLDRLGL